MIHHYAYKYVSVAIGLGINFTKVRQVFNTCPITDDVSSKLDSKLRSETPQGEMT